MGKACALVTAAVLILSGCAASAPPRPKKTNQVIDGPTGLAVLLMAAASGEAARPDDETDPR